MKLDLLLQVEPKPLARTRSAHGIRYYTSEKQSEMNTLRWAIHEAINKSGIDLAKVLHHADTSLKIALTLEFGLSIPKSISNKKKIERLGQSHTMKPDIDNLIKNVLDRGNNLLWMDDKVVYKIVAEKVWSEKGYIKIGVEYY